MHRDKPFPIPAIRRPTMNHDLPNFKTNLRLALAESDTGPSEETLTQAPMLNHWFGVSQSNFPSLFGRTCRIDAPSHDKPIWKRTSVVVGMDKYAKWVRTLNRFYRLSDEPCPSVPEFEKGFGRLVLQGFQAVSQDEFIELIDAFSRRARWYLLQIN